MIGVCIHQTCTICARYMHLESGSGRRLKMWTEMWTLRILGLNILSLSEGFNGFDLVKCLVQVPESHFSVTTVRDRTINKWAKQWRVRNNTQIIYTCLFSSIQHN